MARSTKNTDNIDIVYRQLKDLFDDGEFPSELYNKGLLSLAYEYMLQEDINSTIQMVAECEKSYIIKTMAIHMDDDPKFKTVIFRLVDMIDRSGIKLNEVIDDEEAFWLNKYKSPTGKAN